MAEVSNIQGACDAALHAHSRAALTVIAPTPPDGPNDNGLPVTVVSHRPVELGFVTFVDAAKVRRKRDPGRCYRRAGWEPCGMTAGGLYALRLAPEAIGEPLAPLGTSLEMFA